ncbi:MAG: hypothetical protein H0U70_07460 [Tatlockia sp.]|nr:hypothetical protein [Tatlockia sp.]
MNRTNLQLSAKDIEKKLHKVFNTIRPEARYYKNLHHQFARTSSNIKGYIYQSDGDNNPKKYWLEELSDKIIITTAQMAFEDLATKGSFQSNFCENDLKSILDHHKNYSIKPIHLIIPRVETGFLEDHIVIEYQNSEGSKLIIDSKSSPSGCQHPDSNLRIHTGRQHFFNTEDCGFHVNQGIPVLIGLIKNNQEINLDNLQNDLAVAENLSPLVLNKLEKLQAIYASRNHEGKQQYKTFGFFCGHLASDKLQAVNKILANIKFKVDLFTGFSPIEIDAAQQGVLGKTVQDYLDAVRESSSALTI